MSPAHHSAQHRWRVLVLVAAVLVAVAVVTRSPGTAAPGGPPVSAASTVSAPNAESSAWYCTGQTTPSGQIAAGIVILTNTGTRAVSGSIAAVTDSGATSDTGIAVPARGQVVANVTPPETGAWMSETVVLSGGGVAVTQAVHGPAGWAEAPCQSTTSPQWFFPSGLTTGSNALFIALYNPTSTPDVVDLSFVTPSGTSHPINFQGIVLEPGKTEVENVGAFVQNQARVATTVTTRTGRVVASETQVLAGSGSGLAILAGSPRAERQWSIPESLEVSGGASSIDVFNPGPTTESVTVRARLASGPLSPISAQVLPGTSWVLSTSSETRIPEGDAYAAEIEAKGGPGVVVGRVVAAPSTAQAPQAGMASAVGALGMVSPSHLWVVPSPGSTASPVVPGVLPAHLALDNSTATAEHYVVYVMGRSGTRTLTSGTLAPSAFISFGDGLLFGAGLNPLLVRSSGPLAVSEDVGPAGTYGVVTMPGIPLDAALAG
ncbi:MAG TPA: DUF5719 family protein [Acidimicrobiales bacterium]|nr:DUF5719 family protein [Acidimicrobiales bacterium]